MEIKGELLDKPVILEFENDNFRCYRNESENFLLCETLTPYIPIEDFIATFETMGSVVEKHKIDRFVFDKRTLRAFHQPTMEWYFVEWKQKHLANGLKTHRKILPEEAWFRKCVEAGRAAIVKDYPDFNYEALDIRYCDSLQECFLG